MTRKWEPYWIMDEEHVLHSTTLDGWAAWFAKRGPDARRVAQTETQFFMISTVFLGIDHQFGEGPPLVFETMVFARDPHHDAELGFSVHEDFDQIRYATWDDAVTGHQTAVRRCELREAQGIAMVKEELPEDDDVPPVPGGGKHD